MTFTNGTMHQVGSDVIIHRVCVHFFHSQNKDITLIVIGFDMDIIFDG